MSTRSPEGTTLADVVRVLDAFEGAGVRSWLEGADWRPNRIELIAEGGGRVDLHPIHIDADGSARQPGISCEPPTPTTSQSSTSSRQVARPSLRSGIGAQEGVSGRQPTGNDGK